jgi:hypothetical protein
MKLKTIFACLTLTLLTAVVALTTPLIAQQPPEITPLGSTIVTEEDNKILARVVSQEGIPTSPELKSVLDQSVELKSFGADYKPITRSRKRFPADSFRL